MATLLDFRRRIHSVKNTQQITRAMKFVAAARLRRAQEAALAARPYAMELARVLRSTMARIESPEHPLLAKRSEERILVIVLAGERGWAGAFNSNILKKAATPCAKLVSNLPRNIPTCLLASITEPPAKSPSWSLSCIRRKTSTPSISFSA